MKLLIALFAWIGISVAAFAADDIFVKSGMENLRAVKDNLQLLRQYQINRGDAAGASLTTTTIDQLKLAEQYFKMSMMKNSPPPAPIKPTVRGYYCSAACATLSGNVDSTYTAGASAEFEAEAKVAAVNALQKKYSCSYGIKENGCSPILDNKPASCMAACSTLSGQPDMEYSKVAVGTSLLEAKQNARNLLLNSYTCSYGVTDVKCSEESKPTYCTAACKTLSGTADLSTSAGARGQNSVEAEGAAMQALRAKYACSYGSKIVECNSK